MDEGLRVMRRIRWFGRKEIMKSSMFNFSTKP